MPPRAPLTPTAIRAPASRFVASNSSGSIPPIRCDGGPPAASSETLADQQEFGSCHRKRRKVPPRTSSALRHISARVSL